MFIRKIVHLSACASFVWAHFLNEQLPNDNATLLQGESRVKKLIINGWRAPTGKYPFMVKVQPQATMHYCGGSLISQFHVLTAAHCVSRSGTITHQNVYPYDCDKEACRHEVKKTKYHQQYDAETNFHDIALLLLKKPVSANYRPIKLADFDISEPKYVGLQLSLAGWGFTEKLQVSEDLMETKVKIVSKRTCVEYHEDQAMSENDFCAGSAETDSCYADSGGPLFRRKGGDYVVFGVVSYGDEDCASPFKTDFRMGVYINVFRYRKWITDQIKFLHDTSSFGDQNAVKKLIIKGWKVSPGKYPFMVKVQPDIKVNHCGGSLISPFAVLTAAHCVVEKGILLHQFVYPYDCKQDACRHEVKKSIYHEDFNNDTMVNDVAIIKLFTPFSVSYRPIKMADYDISDPKYEGKQVSLAGWGATEKLNHSEDLMETKVNIISNKICDELHQGHKPENHFCAGSMESDSCYADSGSPLFLPEGGEYVVFGLVSYGDEDCDDPLKTGQRIGVYTNVFRYREWITGHSANLFGKRYATSTANESTFTSGFGDVTVHIF